MKVTASVKYLKREGRVLEFSDEPMASMLFLEFLSEFRSGKHPVQYATQLKSSFRVKMNLPKSEYERCRDYINNNM
jgi:hypothetical protein